MSDYIQTGDIAGSAFYDFGATRYPDVHVGLKTVLVVEDDLTLRPVLEKLLYRINPGLVVHWSHSAEEFLGEEGKHALPPWPKYDLVLTDIYMPGTSSGFDIWKHFSKRAPHTPLVMMSGLSQEEFFRAMGTLSEVPPYLAKPLKFADIRATLAPLLA